MSTLTLVRHGQAHAFEQDSDRLTELGVRQANALGEYWQRHQTSFHEAFSGTLKRHRQTADAVVETGPPLPSAEQRADWNEYPATEILKHLTPLLAQSNPAFAELHRAWIEAAPDQRNRHFQRLFEPLMLAWLAGEVTHSEVETAATFRARVKRAMAAILEGPSSRDVVVFTSGGPIGVCVQETLAAPEEAFLNLNWRVRNASLSEFTFGRGRITLDSFNGLAHLDDRSLWTWR